MDVHGVKLTVLTIRDKHHIEVSVRSDGWFSADYNGRKYSASTLEALRTDLVKATKRARASIAMPVTEISGMQARHATFNGMHEGNGNVLLKYDGAKHSEQKDAWGRTLYKRMTDAEVAEYQALYSASRAAQQAVSDFLKGREANVRDVWAKAQRDAECAD